MKKAAVIFLSLAVLLMPSCKNQNKKAESQNKETPELNTKEDIVAEELKVDLENLMESAKKMKPIPLATAEKDGKISLTKKEKMVKPDYLIDPAAASDLVTLSQKYRAVAMLGTDLTVANLYEMPATDYKNAIAKLLVDINDPALDIFAQTPWTSMDDVAAAMTSLVEDEYAAERPNFFWESAAASMIEQLFVVTRDIDKFMPMFDDQSAADVTFNFICVHEGIKSMVELYPEMESLNAVLEPLYVINAISVDQLKEQLTSLKGDIEAARATLLQ